jgi:hypothetical protein
LCVATEESNAFAEQKLLTAAIENADSQLLREVQSDDDVTCCFRHQISAF